MTDYFSFIRNKWATSKPIFVNITLILRKVLMKPNKIIHQSDVHKANNLCKLRILLKMDQKHFAKNIDITLEALQFYENAECPLPDSVISRACAAAGMPVASFNNGKVDSLFNEANLSLENFAPDNIPSSELFDLLNSYRLIRRKKDFDQDNILSFLKMMVCGRPDIAPQNKEQKKRKL